MNNRNTDHFDKLYSSEENVFGKGKPTEIVEELPELLRSGSRVLDVGGGEGLNAIFLAEHGFDVEVVDVSSVGIAKAQQRAKERGVRIMARVADVLEEGLQSNYDAIIASFVLHLMPREQAKDFIAQAKSHTHAGGLHAIAAFTKQGAFYQENPGVRSCYVGSGELKELYSNWEIVRYREREVVARKRRKDGTPMVNTAAFLIARKEEVENLS